jgi:hypothetical protein
MNRDPRYARSWEPGALFWLGFLVLWGLLYLIDAKFAAIESRLGITKEATK